MHLIGWTKERVEATLRKTTDPQVRKILRERLKTLTGS